MKTLSILFILIFGLSVFGQTKKPSYKTDSTFQATSFNSEIESLPPSFLGHNALSILPAVLSFAKEIDAGCGKFEKQEICQDRLNKMYARPISSKLKANDKLAFSIPLECAYSPNSERIKCDDIAYGWFSTKTEGKPYIGQNAFGAKVIVHTRRTNSINIKTDKITPQFILENYPPEKARLILPNLRCLVIGTLLQPFAKVESFTYDATLKDPVQYDVKAISLVIEAEEVWLYDFVSGKVLAKEKFEVQH